jgi:stress response protein YsnF
MITREQIPQVVGHPVHDSAGKKIGDAKHMYLDDATGNPEWVTVKTGFFGNNETFVPTRSAKLVQDHLEIPYDKDKVKGAPNVDVDSGGHLSVEEERHLYRYYGLESTGAAAGEKAAAAGAAGAAGTSGRHAKTGTQPGMDTSKAAGTGTAGTGLGPDMGADAGPKSGPSAGMREGAGAGGAKSAGTGMSGSEAGAGTGTGYAAERAAAGQRGTQQDIGKSGLGEGDEMIRCEEELSVNVERHASGRARLHKYVEVEEVEKTVPLRHEEVRLVREPITEANRAGMGKAEISEADQYVTLHEEEAIVDTRVVPKERVRMRVEEQTEQKTVHGRVRKERIESDMGMEDTGKAGPEAGGQGRKDQRFQ